jgi:hypothetical protein
MFRISQLVWVGRHLSHANPQPLSDALSICEEPSLNCTDRNSQMHLLGCIRKPELKTRRRTVAVMVKIDKNYPRTESSGVVVSIK